MRILVLGYIVRGPLGGLAWHHLQYVLGLREMGHEVLFLEESDNYPSCYNPRTLEFTTDPHYGLTFINDLFTRFELTEHWSYFDAHKNKWYGLSNRKVKEFCVSADLVLNISGINPVREWWHSIPCRILIDTDPVFTQIKHLTNAAQAELAKAHTHFVTFGENIGKQDCLIPNDGLLWRATRQPVYLNAWQVSGIVSKGSWTTVMQWDSYKSGEFKGKIYGMKSQSFKPFMNLPKLIAPEQIEIALGSASAPKAELENMGFKITDPLSVTETHHSFQRYIASSKGEWTVAKHGYVITNSGWFSERTLNYMACGKPVIVQDTGFSQNLPLGEGLLGFANPGEAVEQFNRVNVDYRQHCASARRIVEEHFDSTKVIKKLLEVA
jgi:hypothetical protein